MNCNLLLKFYNEISGNDFESIDLIPQKTLEFLLLMDEDDLKKPFARKAVYEGRSVARVAVLVGWNRFRVMRIS